MDSRADQGHAPGTIPGFKVYAIDTGMVRTVGFAFSANTGKLLENAAFLALRRRTQEIFYYTTPGGYQVDFYLPETGQLIQVAQDLKIPATRQRELRALADAMRALKLPRAILLTDANAPTVDENGLTIEVRSLAEWLLTER